MIQNPGASMSRRERVIIARRANVPKGHMIIARRFNAGIVMTKNPESRRDG